MLLLTCEDANLFGERRVSRPERGAGRELRKVGNSMTFTLPAEMVRDHTLAPGDRFEARWTDGGIVFTPAVTRWDRLVVESRGIAAREGSTERGVLDEIARIRGRHR